MFRSSQYKVIHDAEGSAGVGGTMRVADYRHVVVMVATSGVGGGEAVTLKAQGSPEETAPAFGSAQSVSNFWDYLQMIDLNSGSGVAGDTGVTVSGSNDFRLFSINTDGLHHLNFELSDITGTLEVTIKAVGYTE